MKPLFYIGQQVACTDDDWIKTQPETPAPEKGKIYTVMGFNCGIPHQVRWWQISKLFKKYVFLKFSEMPENNWHQDHFTPLEELSAEALAKLLEEALAEPVTI